MMSVCTKMHISKLYLFTYLTYLLAYLLACLITCLLIYVLTCLLTYLPTHSLTHSLAVWPSGSLGLLNYRCSFSSFHCLLLPSFNLHVRRSFSTSSNHLNLGLPTLPWSNVTRCPIHSNHFFLMSAAMSKYLYSSWNSWLVHILHIPCTTTGPYIVLSIFFSHVFSLFISIFVMGHVSLPHSTTG